MKVLLALVLLAALPLRGAELSLPDPLRAQDGSRVTTPGAWTNGRRAEVLELFREHIYGRAPIGRPDTLKFERFDYATNAMDGKATRQQIKISYRGPGGEGAIKLLLFTPKTPQSAPCFLLICNRGLTNIDPTRQLRSEFWPAEEVIARGYAVAAFHNADVAADNKTSFETGVHQVFPVPGGRKADSWGTIAAWAWGASRVMDYLETDRAIDARRVAVVGHSRGGKTALWAAAEDARFALAVSNDSGSTGAAIARNKKGEQIADINRGFPYWFNENYKRYNGRENDLPVDQHQLLALIAPRLVYVSSATQDTWADPQNEFLAAVHAGPVFALLGATGLGTNAFPQPDSPIHLGRIGYHLRTGTHNLTLYDWQQFMNFADKHWRK